MTAIKTPWFAALLVAGGFSLVAGPAWSRSALFDVGDHDIQGIVSDIGEGLDQARLSSVPSNGAYSGLTIKFAVSRSESAKDAETRSRVEATAIRVMVEMQRRYADRFRFVSSASRDVLIEEVAAEIANREERDRYIEDIEAQVRPDILVRSLVYERDGRPWLIFQAIAVRTAEILATSRPVSLSDNTMEVVMTEPDEVIVIDDREVAVTREREVAANNDGEEEVQLPFAPADGVFRPIALEAERLLVAHGYDPGEVDGYIDGDLRLALSLYQADSALAVNGRLTWETVENLRRDRRGPK